MEFMSQYAEVNSDGLFLTKVEQVIEVPHVDGNIAPEI